MKRTRSAIAKKVIAVFAVLVFVVYFSAFSSLIRTLLVKHHPAFIENSVEVYQSKAFLEYSGGDSFSRMMAFSPVAEQGSPILFCHVDYIYTVGIPSLLEYDLPEAYFCVDIQYDPQTYLAEKERLLQSDHLLLHEPFDSHEGASPQKWESQSVFEIQGNENGINHISFCDTQSVIRYLYIHREPFNGTFMIIAGHDIKNYSSKYAGIRWD